MKKLITIGAILIASCTPGEKQTAKTVVDIANVLCGSGAAKSIIVEIDPTKNEVVSQTCVEEEFIGGILSRILAEKRAAMAKRMAEQAPPIASPAPSNSAK